MADYIDREKLMENLHNHYEVNNAKQNAIMDEVCMIAFKQPTEDVVPVVRCIDCKHSTELDKHCELNRELCLHCGLWRGDEERNVWHKYKKYYADYSIVSPNDYCSYGERKEE